MLVLEVSSDPIMMVGKLRLREGNGALKILFRTPPAHLWSSAFPELFLKLFLEVLCPSPGGILMDL